MKWAVQIGLFGLIVLGLLATSPAYGAECEPGTLQDYISLGATGCTIGDKVFRSFGNYSFTDFGTGASSISASDISIAPIGASTFAPGLSYQLGAFVSDGEKLDILFNYEVLTIDGSDRITDNTLQMGGHGINGDAGIFIGEALSNEEGALLSKAVFAINGGTTYVQEVFPPQDFLFVEKDIFLTSGKGEGNVAFLSDFTQRFSQVTPEPGSLVLFGFALMSLLTVRKRKANIA